MGPKAMFLLYDNYSAEVSARVSEHVEEKTEREKKKRLKKEGVSKQLAFNILSTTQDHVGMNRRLVSTGTINTSTSVSRSSHNE